MSAYALAHLRKVQPHHEILDYLDKIQATLRPFAGKFLVHGGKWNVREGTWPGQVVLIEFPSLAAARSWYESAPYQEILPLRTRHIEADVIRPVDFMGLHPVDLVSSQRRFVCWEARTPWRRSR